MTALSSLGWLGAEGSNTLHLMRDVMSWIFGIGLVGQGAYIDFRELKTAGGKPLRVGLVAGTPQVRRGPHHHHALRVQGRELLTGGTPCPTKPKEK